MTTDPTSTFSKEIGEKSLMGTLMALFQAGIATTSSTLSWNLLYLCTYPQIQRKVHQEIDRVIGNTRKVTLKDRKNLPYLEAVLNETLRFSSIAPLGIIHSALEDTTLGGHTFPKGTWVSFNQHFVHHNPELWDRPSEFRPERFLSRDGREVVKNENLVAFSVGKRICIGENLLRDTFFLFFSHIYQNFSIKFDPDSPRPSLDSRTNFFLNPQTFKVIVEERTL